MSIVSVVLAFGAGLLVWGLIWQRRIKKPLSERTLRQLRKGLMMQGIMATEDDIEQEELIRLNYATRRVSPVLNIGLGIGVIVGVVSEVIFAMLIHINPFAYSPFFSQFTWILACMLVTVSVAGVVLLVFWPGPRTPMPPTLPHQYSAYRMRLLFWWQLLVFVCCAVVSTLLLTGALPMEVAYVYVYPHELRTTPSIGQILSFPVVAGLTLLIPEIIGRMLIRRPPAIAGVAPTLAVRMQRRALISAVSLLYTGTIMSGIMASQQLSLVSGDVVFGAASLFFTQAYAFLAVGGVLVWALLLSVIYRSAKIPTPPTPALRLLAGPVVDGV